MFRTFQIPLSWTELIKRTIAQISKDNVLGLAAQLSFYLLLALVPAILFLVALTSFFPGHMVEQLIAQLAGVAPPAMVDLLRAQLESIAEGEQGGLLTFGVLMALWSSSAAIVGAIDAMNRVYDIEEGRPWWKVRLTAISLTLALAALVIISMGLVIAGPVLAEWMAAHFGLGPVFEWSWKIVQWPLVVALITVGLGLLNYYGPDAEQSAQAARSPVPRPSWPSCPHHSRSASVSSSPVQQSRSPQLEIQLRILRFDHEAEIRAVYRVFLRRPSA